MSGGSFHYAFQHVVSFAEELARKRGDMVNTEADELPSPTTQHMLAYIQQQAEDTAALMRATEWFYSGDFGEATFMEEIAEILARKKDPL